MGKQKRERTLADTEAKAIVRNLRISPQKLNLVAQLIRGKKVSDALSDLEFSRKRIAIDVRKCVMSAVANAENNHGLDVDDLVVAEGFRWQEPGHEAISCAGTWAVSWNYEALLADHCDRARRQAGSIGAGAYGSQSQSDRLAPRHQPHLG